MQTEAHPYPGRSRFLEGTPWGSRAQRRIPRRFPEARMGPTMLPGPRPLRLKLEIQALRALCLRTDLSANSFERARIPAPFKSVWRAYFEDAKGGRVWLAVAGKNCFIRSGLSCKREITRLI